MSTSTVGIRELKTHLSGYLRRVKAGESFVVTDHGTPVAQLAPPAASVEERMRDLADRGLVDWSGEKPCVPARRIKTSNRVSLSDLVLEGRD